MITYKNKLLGCIRLLYKPNRDLRSRGFKHIETLMSQLQLEWSQMFPQLCGYDSTVVTALLQKQLNKIKTFTIGFEDQDYDEAHMQEKSNILGTTILLL